MKKYCGFLFDKRINIRLAIFALSLILMITLSYTTGFSKGKWVSSYSGYYYSIDVFNSTFYVFGFVFLALCFIEPALMFSFKMKRNSFEDERRLSVSKRGIYFSRYIMGYLEIILPYTIAYFISSIIIFASQGYWEYYKYAFFLYVILHIGGIFIYSFFTFFYLRARNAIDGFVLMALATIAIMLLGHALIYLFNKANGMAIDSFEYRLNPFSVFQWACIYVSDKLNAKDTLDESMKIFGRITTILFSLSIFGIVFHQGDFNVEHANQKSVSWFGYKTLIPLTFIPLMVLKNVVGLPIYYVYGILVYALTYLAYALSYRRFVFSKKGWYIYFGVIGGETILYFVTLFL